MAIRSSRCVILAALLAAASHASVMTGSDGPAPAAGAGATVGAVIRTAAGTVNIATLVTGVLFGVHTITTAEANGVWSLPNPDDNTGRFFCSSDSTITKTVASGTANGTASAHAANAIGGLGWLATHEVSAIPVASGKKSAFASAFARNSTTHKAKISNVADGEQVPWSITYNADIYVGATTNLSSLSPDPADPPELTTISSQGLRVERGSLEPGSNHEGSFHYEFGFGNIRTSLEDGAGGLYTPVFSFDVGFSSVGGVFLSGDILNIPGMISMDPDVEHDGIDWVQIAGGAIPIEFTVSGVAGPADSVDVYFDTYSQAEGTMSASGIPAPGPVALAGLAGLALARRQRPARA